MQRSHERLVEKNQEELIMGEDRPVADKAKYEALRERWDHEDTLLVSRTGTFLTTSSILWAALGFQPDDSFFLIVIGIIGLVLSILWLTTSLHSFNVIGTLFRLCKNDMPYGIKEIYQRKPVLFRPTTVFAKVVPSLMIAGWVVEIAYTIWKLVAS